MLRRCGWLVGAGALFLVGAGCAGKKAASPPPPTPLPQYTPVPTVAPNTPTPTPVPLPTRPIKDEKAEQAKKAGKAIGPVVTFVGITRADGVEIPPVSVGKDGIPVYENPIGSGFQLVVEGKPGLSNLEVGRRIFAHDPQDPRSRPDLEVQVTRDLGNGSTAVCDRRRPKIGGVPGINPPSWSETQRIADALNDLGCRFETFIEPQSSCVVEKQGEFAFVKKESTTQFCMMVAKAWNFPVGETLVSVRLRDSEGNPGPVSQLRLRRVPRPARSTALKPERTPTPVRRRP